jgi:hypothetical protein
VPYWVQSYYYQRPPHVFIQPSQVKNQHHLLHQRLYLLTMRTILLHDLKMLTCPGVPHSHCLVGHTIWLGCCSAGGGGENSVSTWKGRVNEAGLSRLAWVVSAVWGMEGFSGELGWRGLCLGLRRQGRRK